MQYNEMYFLIFFFSFSFPFFLKGCFNQNVHVLPAGSPRSPVLYALATFYMHGRHQFRNLVVGLLNYSEIPAAVKFIALAGKSPSA